MTTLPGWSGTRQETDQDLFVYKASGLSRDRPKSKLLGRVQEVLHTLLDVKLEQTHAAFSRCKG